ncbi:2-succinyl-6-hydroxy-2,4-cyclohexadiene-1-carboxylate synthase [Alteribacter lacisalsi]|uniref:2-succinyl-6-hydroxy-2, 4-cyclohexadiene-1-carboxylate synthase n=1 Tax=Alteribacter lacisalsi TaxID=2045244 RepID=A0A2W0HG60_9BACI|nr:alpha/beta hydrolase [Alteribacter lacisalsi]PYZ96375.1 2-succinyl-6-hydroxy-2,4-cyclohexadiene-1-carboxylate synthase [Alteribacter lacisalsi]
MLHYKTYPHRTSREWVVFLHGLGGSSSIWFKQIKAFREHYNLLLVDLRGHGKSKGRLPDLDSYDFKHLSREVLEVLDHQNISKAHFVGISLGSVVINTINLLSPQHVQSMVLGGAITRFNLRSRLLIHLGDAFKKVLPYMWLYKLFAGILMPRKNHAHSRRLFTKEATEMGQKEFIRWFQITKKVEPLHQEVSLSAASRPKLYLMGSEDYMFLPLVKEDTDESKNETLSTIEGSGHVCNMDKPKEFNKKALAFFQLHAEREEVSDGASLSGR